MRWLQGPLHPDPAHPHPPSPKGEGTVWCVGRDGGQGGKGAEQGIGIVGAAGDEEGVEAAPVVGVDGGAGLQDGVGIGVAGEERQGDVAIGAEGGQFVDAILEIGGAADEAEDDEARVGNGVFQPEIDGEIVGEAQRIGEAQLGLT